MIRKKFLFLVIIILSLTLFTESVFANTIGLSVDKSTYLVGERACFNVSLPFSVQPNTPVEVTFYSYGPNNRGCTSGCTQNISRNLFGFALVCTNEFVREDVGSWRVYVSSSYGQSNEVGYQVLSHTNLNIQGDTTPSAGTIKFTANESTNLEVYVGNTIQYYWWTDIRGDLVSWYTADAPDNCPGGISSAGEIKPWIISASGMSGNRTATVQQCQEGRTYTITLAVRDQASGQIKGSTSVVIRVKRSNESLSFCSVIRDGGSYTIEQFRSLVQPYFEKEFQSCRLQLSYVGGRPTSTTPYYSPSGDPSMVPPGNLYKADQYSFNVNTGQLIRVGTGTLFLCSYSDQPLAMVFGGSWVGELCMPGKNVGVNTQYCFNPPINVSTLISERVRSVCGKSINISGDTSVISGGSTMGGVIGGNTGGVTTTTTTVRNVSPTDSVRSGTTFNPQEIAYYQGPIRLSFENNQQQGSGERTQSSQPSRQNESVQGQSTTQRPTSNINVSNEAMRSLVDILERLTNILESANRLPSEAQEKLIQVVQSITSIIQDILRRI